MRLTTRTTRAHAEHIRRAGTKPTASARIPPRRRWLRCHLTNDNNAVPELSISIAPATSYPPSGCAAIRHKLYPYS